MNKIRKHSFDWVLCGVFFSILIVGWFIKVAATPATSFYDVEIFNIRSTVGMQTYWTIACILVFLSVLLIEKKFWNIFSLPIYGLSLLLLLLVLVFGSEINGAKSWISLGGFSLQPSELAKFATCLSLSNFLANPSVKLDNFRSIFISLIIISAPILLILLQPDMGSALVFFAFSFVLFRNGISIWPFIAIILLGAVFIMTLSFSVYSTLAFLMITLMLVLGSQNKFFKYWLLSISILTIANIVCFYNELEVLILIFDACIAIMFIFLSIREGQLKLVSIISSIFVLFSGLSYATSFVFFNVLKPHQQDRLNAWLHPELCDPRGSLYNVILSKMAISSGGMNGKGYMEGTLTKLNYVPEHTTDFIFCIVGEEQGFIGSMVILSIFFIMIFRIIYIAEKSNIRFVSNFGYGFAGILFFHVFINIGMTIGLVPVIGIPLPFISYGGSALLGFSLMFAVFLNISSKEY
ncbi:rod shape-determining protein RodA [Membranihabitans marinus]|uniref:rod shape-determining protein RodA n=1 Tax=Membranihabitans marinus TaxID=1227546 RepID=UPI001F0112A5|nr:rod shape-determining protein RodA [Membranihabitans marinus]